MKLYFSLQNKNSLKIQLLHNGLTPYSKLPQQHMEKKQF